MLALHMGRVPQWRPVQHGASLQSGFPESSLLIREPLSVTWLRWSDTLRSQKGLMDLPPATSVCLSVSSHCSASVFAFAIFHLFWCAYRTVLRFNVELVRQLSWKKSWNNSATPKVKFWLISVCVSLIHCKKKEDPVQIYFLVLHVSVKMSQFFYFLPFHLLVRLARHSVKLSPGQQQSTVKIPSILRLNCY